MINYLKYFTKYFGAKLFSFRRVFTSLIISVTSLFFFTIVFGIYNTTPYEILKTLIEEFSKDERSWALITIGVLIPITFNFIPDFFSYQVTFYFLKKGYSNNTKLLRYVLADFLISTIIFLFGIILYIFIASILATYVRSEGYFTLVSELFKITFMEDFEIINKDGLLIFYLTTMVTSLILWIYTLDISIKRIKNIKSNKKQIAK